MNKLVNKYTALIKSNKMTKAEVNSMRKALGRCSSLNQDEKRSILDAFYNQVDKKGGIKITEEHTTQGLNYLNKLAFTSKGQPRRTKEYPFGNREIEALKTFKEFRLVGLDEGYNGMGEMLYYAPIWLVKGKEVSFEYTVHGQWGALQVVR